LIGLALSLVVSAVLLVVRLAVLLVIWTFRITAMIVIAVFGLLAALWAKRSRVPNARQPMAQDIRWLVFRRDGYACVWCGSVTDLTVDHIHPVALGGTNELSNLQTLCRTCNSRKGIMASPGRYRRRESRRLTT
jgi:hypothetical protein